MQYKLKAVQSTRGKQVKLNSESCFKGKTSLAAGWGMVRDHNEYVYRNEIVLPILLHYGMGRSRLNGSCPTISKMATRPWHVQYFISEIHHLLKQMEVSATNIWRERNAVADWLANTGHKEMISKALVAHGNCLKKVNSEWTNTDFLILDFEMFFINDTYWYNHSCVNMLTSRILNFPLNSLVIP